MSRARSPRHSAHKPRGESFTPQLSGDDVGHRVEILRVASGVRYFRPGQFGYIIDQNANGGMWLLDTGKESRPSETAFLIAKTRDARGGAFWFSAHGFRDASRATHEAREDRSERPISMTYGQLPPLAQFLRDVSTRINPDDGKPYLEKGQLFPMELVGQGEIDLAQKFGGLDEFDTTRAGYAYGFRGDARAIYKFLKFLAKEFDKGNDEAGDLASSIMTVLGYEWI